MPTAQFTIDGATGDITVIAAPTAPSFIEITEIQLTVSATSEVNIKSGSNVIDVAYLGTGNRYEKGKSAFTGAPVLRCNPGEAFVVNNSAGTIAGGGTYRVVGVGQQTDWATFPGSN